MCRAWLGRQAASLERPLQEGSGDERRDDGQHDEARVEAGIDDGGIERERTRERCLARLGR